MGKAVCSGATLLCSAGLTPSSLLVIRPRNLSGPGGAANIKDHWPLRNIGTFGLCRSMGNPAVAAATARNGFLTPMPCFPSTPWPWSRHRPHVLFGRSLALDSNSHLGCSYGGVIHIMFPGQRPARLV